LPRGIESRKNSIHVESEEAVAEEPFADLDPIWANGIVNSEQWVQIVYLTL
jgi:hypothetical protein